MKRRIAGSRCQLQKSSTNAPSSSALARLARGESVGEVGVDRLPGEVDGGGRHRAAYAHRAVAREVALDVHQDSVIGMRTPRSAATSWARS